MIHQNLTFSLVNDNKTKIKAIWIFDAAASDHVTNNKEISSNIGSILLATSKADFYWSRNDKVSREYEEFKIIRNHSRKNETLDALNHLAKALHDLNVGNKEKIEAFSKEWFDIPIFFKSLAVS